MLDLVALANCILTQTCDADHQDGSADVNADDAHNVLDLVALANCILAQTCMDDQNA